jgi:O-antigen/teichoic acid export membrane protein
MNFLFKIAKQELVSGSFFIFVGTTISNVLAFAFNLFLARTLVASDYGVYASLLSIITLFSIPSMSLTPVIVRFATEYFSKNENEKAKLLYQESLKTIIFTSVLLFFLFFVFSRLLAEFLHIDNVYYILLSGFIICFSYMSLANNAFLQSLLRFGRIAFILSFSSLIKLISGFILVFSGFKVFGGLFAILLMSISILVIGFIFLRFLFKKVNRGKITISVTEILAYAAPTTLAMLALTSFISIDVILVKHFFDPDSAGLYSGLSLMGKVIFYFSLPIPMVMFPLIVKRHSSGKKVNSLFYLGILMVLTPSIGITVFYFLFPQFAINFFLGGGEYLRVASLIGLFGIFLTIFNLVHVFVYFFLSLKHTKIAWVVALGAICQIVLISLFHSSFYQVITVSIVAMFVVLLPLIAYFLKKYIINVK